MKKITGKRYYSIHFCLESPLSVGSGENGATDRDIITDSNARPYIPGSSLAGVYRSVLEPQEADKYFGKLLDGTEEIDESLIIVYDAEILSGQEFVSKRDMVALDEYKVAREGAKFDMQIVEPGVEFITYIEQDLEKDAVEAVMDTVLAKWMEEGLCFGAKTRRGYGKTRAVKVKWAEFRSLHENESWLNFNLYDENDPNWKLWERGEEKAQSSEELDIMLALTVKGGLSVREYSAQKGKADYKQLTLHGVEHVPVIPGTSWAGAFRAQMRKLGMTEEEQKNLFGFVEAAGAKSKKRKSRISFSESYVKGGTDITYTRNAIDRFTNAVIDGALYTESTHYYGRTSLQIRCVKSSVTDKVAAYLAAAIMDLANGYLVVGGLTAVGRGMFQVDTVTVNGKKSEITYNAIMQSIKEAV